MGCLSWGSVVGGLTIRVRGEYQGMRDRGIGRYVRRALWVMGNVSMFIKHLHQPVVTAASVVLCAVRRGGVGLSVCFVYPVYIVC